MPGTPSGYVPATSEDRLHWWAKETLGPTSWLAGGFSSGWSTIFNDPKEWGRSPEGFGRRLGTRMANVAVANGLEVGLGAVWGEDMRFNRQGQGSFRSRAGHVVKMTLMARYRDGNTRFAFARMIGNVGGNVTQNFWMPPSGRGAGNISYNVAWGVSARLSSNAFQEFWPDMRKVVFRK